MKLDMKQLGLILLLILGWSGSASAQRLESFSEEAKPFLKELEDYVTASKVKSNKQLFETLKGYVDQGVVSDTQVLVMRDQCELMLQQRMRAAPYFTDYIELLNTMIEVGEFQEEFGRLSNILRDYLSNLKRSEMKNYGNYLQFFIRFYAEQALHYTNDNAHRWLYTSDAYQFVWNEKENEISVEFPKMTLICQKKEDSTWVQNTDGIYYPLTKTWKGFEGKVDWGRTRLGSGVYCTFGAYEIDCARDNFKVQEVMLTYPELFKNPIPGSLIDQVELNAKVNHRYPKFKSAIRTLDIPDILPGVDFRGGFELQGTSISGYGTGDEPAILDFNHEGEKVARAKADRLILEVNERIQSRDAEVSLYINAKDSIYHPIVVLDYKANDRKLVLKREGKGVNMQSFTTSRHGMAINAPLLVWELGSKEIQIGKNADGFQRANAALASFASNDLFNYYEYINFQNIGTINPIASLYLMVEQRKTRTINAAEFARFLNPNYYVSMILPLLNKMTESGFIEYDSDKEEIVVNDKTIHYARSYTKKRDYDVIEIISNLYDVNATLNLEDGNIYVDGVTELVLSDSQLVALKPYEEKIIIKENRDLDFGAVLYAGFSVLEGDTFHFKYDDFKIEVKKADAFTLRIPDYEKRDEYGRPKLVQLGTRLENLSGEILIDRPKNKASIDNYQEYPMLICNDPSYVYYDSKETQGGGYDRDSFFFEVRPFVIDSLDSFDPDNVQFEGQLVSAGIFPDFDENLKVQSDLSLGFKTKTPEEGYPIYGGKGTFNGEIGMNNKGLLGVGTLDYLAADINSEDFTFLPNRMTATADSFNLKESVSGDFVVPKVQGAEVSIDWRPYVDSMYVIGEPEKPFRIFNDSFSFRRELVLTPGGLYGKGKLDWQEGDLTSKSIRFSSYGLTSDTASMNIKSEGTEGKAFSSSNVAANIDFDERIGRFQSNTTSISTDLPASQYRTSMSEFVWDMDEKTIAFSANDKKATFLAADEDRFNLAFDGESARYDLQTNELNVYGVPFISVADAEIVPDSGYVEIHKGGAIETLQNATINADTINNYHRIHSATVTIKSKREYAGNGIYDYDVGPYQQQIKMGRVNTFRMKGRDPNYQTFAEGIIPDSTDFFIDQHTAFKGRVKLEASSKALDFDGYARISSPKVPRDAWFKIGNAIDKDSVTIAYDEPLSPEGYKLYTGLFIKRDTGLVYPRVLMAPYSRQDRSIFDTRGLMRYQKGADQFLFGDSTVILDGSLRGNKMTFNRVSGRFDVEGSFTFGSELPYIGIDVAGMANMDHKGENSTFNTIIGLDMLIPEKLLNFLARDLETNSYQLNDANYDQDYIRKGLREFITDDKKLQRVFEEMKEYGKVYLPKGSKEYAFFFGNARMEWNPDRYAFINKKGGLTLSYLDGRAVHKVIDAYVEVRMTPRRDELNIYINTPAGTYYYFNYSNRILSVFSSNPDFNQTIVDFKKKEKQFKMDDGQLYEIKLTTPSAAKGFYNRINY